MIQIDDNDLPITVASKLINATREIPEENSIAKILNKAAGGDGKMDMFDEDELMEIAEHLICYCKHADGGGKCDNI